MEMNGIKNQNFSTIQQFTQQYFNPRSVKEEKSQIGSISFEDILKSKREAITDASTLKFSKHADNRLMERRISLSESQIQRLSDGTQKAKEKGIKESLVMVDEYAFIVNTKSNTVITAMNKDESNDTIITNIDGAVII